MEKTFANTGLFVMVLTHSIVSDIKIKFWKQDNCEKLKHISYNIKNKKVYGITRAIFSKTLTSDRGYRVGNIAHLKINSSVQTNYYLINTI